MHASNAGAHQQRTTGQPRMRQGAQRDQPQREHRRSDGQCQRKQGDRQVVSERNGQAEGQHADEVHRPDAQAHGEAAAQPPPPGRALAGCSDRAPGHRQRGVRGHHGNQQRDRHQPRVVRAYQHSSVSRTCLSTETTVGHA
ncbi:hypothetical protein G6F31_019760 [Rhizopus arrhizus]|nr:hypothetical protein G6F31_019760 [Rhizopus arrhizus]